MRTVTITLYTFDELADEARQKAIDKLRDINVDYPDWHELVLNQAKEDLAAAGYDDAEISYRGFWSQGDGACFKARVDLKTWLKAKKLSNGYRALSRNTDDTSIEITQGGHYCHEYTMGISVRYHGGSFRADAQFAEVQEHILQDARDRARDIYHTLEREHEYQTSDEQVVAAIRANEYEFDDRGNLA